ncbi:MAG: serine hydrolase [Candidatus Pacebacteria bacterium]|nr:serine hydrolase [Candidatus Paceibacterota bacterium]MDD5555216.1 serine hydrolase [Candidatus Paceibacterota bacterium]
MKKNDWVFFFFLLIFLFSIVFTFKENVLAKDDFSFVPLTENSLFRPLPKEGASRSEFDSLSYLSVFVDKNNTRVFLEKNSQEKVFIASLTKLMTAVIVLENYDLEDRVFISEKAIATFGLAGEFQKGEVFPVKDLLYILLVESSNDAAEAFAEKMGPEQFVSSMNRKAKELGMESTVFFNPSGLDFEVDKGNQSSASDLEKLVIYIVDKHPLIAEMLSVYEMDMYYEGGLHHYMRNTNVLLEEDSLYVWGKTGYTIKAKECIVLVMRPPFSKDENSYIINVIMGSENRFKNARLMEQWIKESFYW